MEGEESSFKAVDQIYSRLLQSNLSLFPPKTEEIQKEMPSPYSEGVWLTLDQITDNLKYTASKNPFLDQNNDSEINLLKQEKIGECENSIGLENEEEQRGHKTEIKEEKKKLSSEEICFPVRNQILKGPVWNPGVRKHSSNLEHFHDIIFDTRRISLKTPEEMILKGEEWIPAKPITTSLARFLIKRLKGMDPNKTALLEIETSRSITYGELLVKAESLASGLTWLGLQSGQVLAIISYNSIEAFLMFLASLMIGTVAALIDSKLGIVGLGIKLRQTCPHLVFCEAGKTQSKVVTAICNLNQALQQRVPHLVVNTNSVPTGYFTFNQLLKEIDPEYPLPVPREADPDRPILILFSDSENSKGCLTGERAFTYSKMFVDTVMPEVFEGTVTVLFTPPFFFSPMVKSLLNHWIDGHRIAFFRGPSPEATILTALRKYEVFAWLTIRSSLLGLLQWPAKPRCPHLKLVAVTGTPLRVGSITRIYEEVFQKNVQILQVYAVTENGIVSANSFLMNKFGSMGMLHSNTHLKILEEWSGMPLGPYQEGEICIKSPLMMLGFYNDPEANAEALDSEGFVRTGDLGYYDDKGFLYVTDRVRDMIKWKNYTISPSLVEAVLTDQPEVKEAFVFGLYDIEDGELVTAAIILDQNFDDVDTEVLEKRVNGLLPNSRKIRGGIHVFTEFPRHTLGKTVKEPVLYEVMNRIGMIKTHSF